MERKKRSKGSGWECCYANTIFGTFGVEMRASGQKLVKFCTHTLTHTHTHTHAVKISSRDIIIYIIYWSCNTVFCLGFFCRARRPAPFSWRPALLKKPKWRPALLTKIVFFFFFLNISHTWLLALFCPFCCPHTAWIVLCIFYWAIQGHFLVSSALFHPFTALIMPFFFSSPC